MFNKIKTVVLNVLVFLYPLFFFSSSQDPFTINKVYFLAFGIAILIILSILEFAVSRKIVWKKKSFDYLVLTALLGIVLSIVFVSPNKIQALLNTNLGLIKILPLALLYFYISREKNSIIRNSLYYSAVTASLISLIFLFQPLKGIKLPAEFQFIQAANFTPLGNYLELAIFLGFLIVWEIAQIASKKHQQIGNKKILNFSFLLINIIAFGVAIFFFITPLKEQQSLLQIIFYPFRLAWYAAVETAKIPLNLFFGVGIDNFSSIFTQVKDVAYNQSDLWQISYFTVSRSLLLHIFTETGLVGLAAFTWILVKLIKRTQENLPLFACTIFTTIVIVFLPPTAISLFLLFVLLGEVASQDSQQVYTLNLQTEFPLVIMLVIISLAITGAYGYLLGRSYLAEYYYLQANKGVSQNNLKIVYDNLKQALILNPYSEKYATDFSRINLQYAMNIIVAKNQKKEAFTDEERTAITQAIQQAISEAKRIIALNPQKAANWENLAIIYKNIINIAQEADVWTVSAYQRAIIADPQNPIYRINLGGIYYSLNNYEEAGRYFEQAVNLKPNWPNSYYNLAWSNFQQNNVTKAVNAMENVIKLIDQKKDKVDYDKALADLETFKKKLKANEEAEQASKSAASASGLSLPEKTSGIDPKLDIPNQ